MCSELCSEQRRSQTLMPLMLKTHVYIRGAYRRMLEVSDEEQHITEHCLFVWTVSLCVDL